MPIKKLEITEGTIINSNMLLNKIEELVEASNRQDEAIRFMAESQQMGEWQAVKKNCLYHS